MNREARPETTPAPREIFSGPFVPTDEQIDEVAFRAALDLMRDREDLAASVRRLHDILGSFNAYYQIPVNHPDSLLILAECRRAFVLLERVKGEGAMAPGGERAGEGG
jgi:hypothetical protein